MRAVKALPIRSILTVLNRNIGAFLPRGFERLDVLSAELHTHSALSYDGRDSVDLLLGQAEAIGLDALAVTDHDEIDASLDAVDRAASYNLIGIPGIEVTTRDGHVLGLGVRSRIQRGRPFEQTLTQIRDAGGIAVVPHPFQKSRNGVGPNVPEHVLAQADAIEVYNSRLLTGRGNRQAGEFADRFGLPKTAGSDAHISEMVGQAVTLVDAEEPTIDGIIDAIKSGRTEIGGKRTPWRISIRQAAGGAKRRVLTRLRERFA